MDPLAVQQIKLKELIRTLEARLESDRSTNRKASLELKAKLTRMRARVTRSQSGYSREAAKQVLAIVMRDAAELAIRLVIEAFIRSGQRLLRCNGSNSAPHFAGFELRAA